MKRILFTIGAIVLVSAIVYVAYRPAPVTVETASVTRGELTVTLDEEGFTRVRERHLVLAPLDGLLHRITLDPGDDVVAQTTHIATVEPLAPGLLDERSVAMAEARVGAARAAVKRARELELTAKKLLASARDEVERLRRSGSATSQISVTHAEREALFREGELAAAGASIRVAEYDLEQATAALLLARPQGEDGAPPPSPPKRMLIVRAPADGKVLRVLRMSEGPVRIGEPLVELGDTHQLEIVADYLTTEAVRIRPGMEATIGGWGGESELVARVRRVEPSAVTKVSSLGIEEQRVNVILDLASSGEESAGLEDGFRVEVRVTEWRGKDVLLVPEGALVKDAEGWFVFVLDGHRAWRTAVKPGHRDGRQVEILSELAPGTEVLLYPGDRVGDGVRIERR
ncbi:efflux RND transporter periplasmic adaptor subunit [Planctomycetes bacterium Poly30]|uniref:efflux RND transporter periplasmic adaptor subunit n=1 Tax=Saltatorellus ferox TaxID=2528018 RepID=UPI0011A49179